MLRWPHDEEWLYIHQARLWYKTPLVPEYMVRAPQRDDGWSNSGLQNLQLSVQVHRSELPYLGSIFPTNTELVRCDDVPDKFLWTESMLSFIDDFLKSVVLLVQSVTADFACEK